ncbi:MAG: adenosylhomocysteinase [Desulfurococcales archaeon]|nr:adenosylhomocysteinase [Desulfurococcales archaeon]
MKIRIKNLELAGKGKLTLEWAEKFMPVTVGLRKEYGATMPLKGVKIGAVLHVTKETGVLVRTLKALGADVYLAGSNPLSTQDDIAAALYSEGVSICAWRGQSSEEYFGCIEEVVLSEPDIAIDDGADLHAMLHGKHNEIAVKVIGGTEETTTGVIRLKALEKEDRLLYPVIAVNNAYTKHLFDNRYGTGQSTVDGVLRATNVLIAGKKVVVAGYGWVGRGIAMRMRGMGGNVIVTEIDPIRALEAVMDGYTVMSIRKAAEIGDIFVTATGDKNVISYEDILKMKNGVILANSGHFNVEIDVENLEAKNVSKRVIRENLTEYTLENGRKVYLLGEGRLVNLVAAEGHPSEVMDMSFANQALAAMYLVENRGKLGRKVYNPPLEIDREIASRKLRSMDIEIDKLTEEQMKYLSSWK